MLGAIAGDIIGSVYENARLKTKEFALFAPGSSFTDDSVLTIAIADDRREVRDGLLAFNIAFGVLMILAFVTYNRLTV